MAIFIVAAYAVASESSGNDYEGVSQDDKGCKSQTLNSLNESYVGCLWALAIAKVTDCLRRWREPPLTKLIGPLEEACSHGCR